MQPPGLGAQENLLAEAGIFMPVGLGVREVFHARSLVQA